MDTPTDEEIAKAAEDYAFESGEDEIRLIKQSFIAGVNWARSMSPKPLSPSCDHAVYLALPEPRPRHCPTCGSKMWDAGD